MTDNDALARELFDHIKHGDAEHQSWLLGSLLSFFATRHVRSTPQPKPFQQRVDAWMDACFGETIKADRIERCDRFIEEALELAQTEPAFTKDRAHALVDYVFDRPQGEINQEVGGVMVTLAALCNTFGVDYTAAAETELARVWTKVEQIRAKQAAKPTGSALPVAQPKPLDPPAQDDVLREALAKAVAEVFAKRPWISMARNASDLRLILNSHGMIPPGDEGELTVDAALSAADHIIKAVPAIFTSTLAALDQHRTTPSAPQSSDAVEQPASRSPSPEKTPGVEAAGGEGLRP